MRRNQVSGMAAAALAALLAASCTPRSVPVDVPTPGPRATVPQGFEGSWVDSKGAVSRFAGGVFSTVAGDTGEKLSEGNYVRTAPNSVTITGVSLARQRRNLPADVSFNCLLATPNQLNCTSSGGANFVLTRRPSSAA